VYYRLSWWQNNDSLDVGLVANRLLARRIEVHWIEGAAHGLEAGDYLVECDSNTAASLCAAGITLHPWPDALPEQSRELAYPRIALLAGEVSAYPYFGFYALALLRLGYSYLPVDGAAIAEGALGACDLLILPGGFATWGLDAGERAPGADAAVRAFINAGGACLGSCGGAFYLSSGRPGWTGTAPIKPHYTHEYLQTGAAILNIDLNQQHPLATGLPASVEIPYYHGPIYDPAAVEQLHEGTSNAQQVEVTGTFGSLTSPSRLMIDNPVDAEKFSNEIKDRAAILVANGPRGRAILFSPHPEMGDLVRKYVTLDGYVRRYLPIRGHGVMQATITHYRPVDAPAFRMILNAVHVLAERQQPTREPMLLPVSHDAPVCSATLGTVLDETLGLVTIDDDEPHAAILFAERDDLWARIAPAMGALTRALAIMSTRGDDESRSVIHAWNHAAAAVCEHLGATVSSELPVAQRLMEVELAVGLAETCTALCGIEQILDENTPAR
jgi:hypothetical protein